VSDRRRSLSAMISLDPSAVPPPHRKLEVEEDEGLFCDENRCLGGYEEIVIHGGRKMDDVAPCWQKNHLKNPPCQKNHFKNRQGGKSNGFDSS
jgi:hypothetical protein